MRTKKVRVTVVVSVALSVVILCVWAACIKMSITASAMSSPSGGYGPSYILSGYSEQDSYLLQALHASDIQWLEHTSLELENHILSLSQEEAGRRELAIAKANARANFLQSQATLVQQQLELQQQLDERAQQDIAALGGIEATTDDVVFGTPRPLRPVEAIAPSETPELPVESQGPVVVDDYYFGQFKATFVCTCVSCLKSSEGGEVTVGAQYILADPEYLTPGLIVTLDNGSLEEFEVRDSDGLVTGRELLVFNANHDEANGSMLLYPKVYKKG